MRRRSTVSIRHQVVEWLSIQGSDHSQIPDLIALKGHLSGQTATLVPNSNRQCFDDSFNQSFILPQ